MKRQQAAANHSIALGCVWLLLAANACPDEIDWEIDWPPVDRATLDALRGGFDAVNGLTIGFGIERTAYVNGELVAKHSVRIPDVAAMTPEQAAALDQAVNSVVLIQNGSGNSFEMVSAPAGATIVQNTLNDQHIVTLTTINADVSSLAVLRSLAAQESLQLALTRAVGGR